MSKQGERRGRIPPRGETRSVAPHARETTKRSRSITNVANGRGVRYFRHDRSTWCHIFRTCRTDSPNTRPTTGGSLNGGLARARAHSSPFLPVPFSVCLSLAFLPWFFSSLFHAVDGDECHCALRENVSTMYEVFRERHREPVIRVSALLPFALLKARAMIRVAENLGDTPANFDIEREQRRVTERCACRVWQD